MSKFEYKTIVLPFRMGVFKQGLPDIRNRAEQRRSAGMAVQADRIAVNRMGKIGQYDCHSGAGY
jgi:hypothetical protein